jgi:hypothetical protein
MYGWKDVRGIVGRSYKCGFCGNTVGPDRGFSSAHSNVNILLCPNCDNPTFFSGGDQIPAPLLGNEVKGVPEKEVNSLYTEARSCTAVNAFTSAVLACRKMLMHIAVDKGAPTGKSFIEYVEYLASKGYIPPDGKPWVDHIRQKGNEANHEIKIMNQQDAIDLITFIEMLLKFIYEFPSRIPRQRSAEP